MPAHTHPGRPRMAVAVLALAAATAAVAQAPPTKRPLKHSDYEIWNAESGVTLSPDGKWLAYTVLPSEGDGQVIVKSLTGTAEYRVARGGRPGQEAGGEESATVTPTPAPTPTPGGGRFAGRAAAAGGGPQFTPDGKQVVFSLTPPRANAAKGAAEKGIPRDAARPVLAVLNLADGKIVERIPGVRTFRVVGESPAYLVMHKEARPDQRPPEAGAGAVAGGPAAAQTAPPTPPAPGGTPAPGGRRFQGRPGAATPAAGAATPTRAVFGTDLVVRNLATGSERTFADVAEFSLTKDAKLLVYTVASRKDESNGVYAAAPDSQAAPLPLKAGKGRYSRLTWDDKQHRLAFFYDDNPALPPASPPAEPTVPPTPAPGTPRTGVVAPQTPLPPPAKLRVFLWERAQPQQVALAPMGGAVSGLAVARAAAREAVELLGPTTPGLKTGWLISDRGGLRFSEDGLKLVLSTLPPTAEAPRPPSPAPTTTAGPRAARPNDDKVELDIWHWKDELIQPMQKVRGGIERARSYSAVYFFDTKQFRHLSDENVTVGVPDYGDWAVASNDKPYRYLTGYGANLSDHALVNVRTGEAKPVLKAATSGLLMSPKNKAAVTFDGKDWHGVAIPGGEKVNLTAKLPVKFFSEEFDSPMEAPSYGFAGWTSDERHVLLSDKYDVWKVAIDGSSATNLTGIGRESKTRFRISRAADATAAEPEPGPEPTTPAEPPAFGRGGAAAADRRAIDLSRPLLLEATNLVTRDTGFYRLEPGGKPKMLVMGARRYAGLTKAAKGDTYLMTVSTFSDYPDHYVTGPDFKEIRRVTDVNPRKHEFVWGKAELVHYKSLDGVDLSGVLVKPEDFDPAKKYPMIVYIYERLSDTLHAFRPPAAGTSINPTFYASNGYLVYMPDIAYTVGSPGQSALKCVLPAIQAVADKGFVDEKAIGIQGHSWGGYQIAYMVTQTNRFKAAAAGAPVSNMVSAYGGIRWGTGLPRQFQYERTQSRIGAKLWDAPLKFIENSPIFMADRVQTPLLMLHNDQDDAVPWYQGIEYYLALRRLGKECYLLNYNGEPHGLRKKANQRDYTLRMQQFFDHHLKGAPMPAWMAKGVPFADREKEKEQWKGLFQAEKK